MTDTTCYFAHALDPKEIRKRATIIKKILDHFQITPRYVFGRGISGVLALPVFSETLTAKIAIFRKPGDSSHAGHGCIELANPYDFSVDGHSSVIIDDFCSTGHTMMEIKNHMVDQIKNPQALIFYTPNAYRSIEGTLLDESDWKDIPRIGISEDGKFVFTKNLDMSAFNGTIGIFKIKTEDSH